MPHDLLFELGLEELPASVVSGVLPELEARLSAALGEARLDFDSISVTGSPRRLCASVKGLPRAQSDLSEDIVGPPARVAFADDGTPTKAAEGFARKNGVELSALSKAEVTGKKGEYVVAHIERPGQPTAQVLGPLLSQITAGLPWPKSMRWGWGEDACARPLHWIVAVLGVGDECQTVDVGFAGIVSGRRTYGHRFLAPAAIEVDGDYSAYDKKLRQAFVVVDRASRRTMIEAELSRVEREESVSVRPDEELVAEVVDLVEYPIAVCGTFDSGFLRVPEEVIVSAMRSHQRYFAVDKPGGGLDNRFVTIAGTITEDVAAVRAGNQRVLAARLADAGFFFDEDQKKGFAAWQAQLESVVFQRKLGTIADKVARIQKIAAKLADSVSVSAELVDRAAGLCKADLVSHMVYEFPDLQGTMGRRYAELAGEDDGVARAIEDHYKPRGAGAELAATDIGAVLAVADRIDTIVGCFAAGLSPSGSADPYGLRRASLGILATLIDRRWSVAIGDLIAWAASEIQSVLDVSDDIRREVHDFLVTRLRGLITQDGGDVPGDCVDAALAAGADDVPDARDRALAVAELRARADFEPLASAFKRVANILKGKESDREPDPEAFENDHERGLWQSFTDIEERALRHLEDRNYRSALTVLAELKSPVDLFFESVLVMAEDPSVRDNRLALLGRINQTFTRIADFRQLAV